MNGARSNTALVTSSPLSISALYVFGVLPHCFLSNASPASAQDEPLDDETWEARQVAELERLKKRLRVEKLLSRASQARCGVACDIDKADPLGRRRMDGWSVMARQDSEAEFHLFPRPFD